jgi:hypothetical protein
MTDELLLLEVLEDARERRRIGRGSFLKFVEPLFSVEVETPKDGQSPLRADDPERTRNGQTSKMSASGSGFGG